MKLKGFLKGLCTLGLTTLLISFASAGLQEFDLLYTEEITANTSLGYSLELKNGANFLLNDTYKLVQFKGSGQYPRQITYFWNGSGMYLIVGRPYRNPADIKVQGFLQYVNIVQYSEINMSYGVSPGFTPIEDFINDSQYSNPDKLLLGGYEDSQNQSLCFVYSSLDKAVCFAYNDAIDCGGQPQFCTNGVNNYITNSLGLSSWDLSYLAPFTTNSPFTSITPSTPDMSDIIYIYPGLTGINNEYYQAFLDRGYYTGLCYSIFYTGTLVESGDTLFDMFQGDIDDSVYYGHSVFDFYEAENSTLSTHSWSQQRYSLMKYAYEKSRYSDDNSALSSWVGKQKGTFNIMFNIYNNQFNDNFNWIDYWTFCDMTVNGFNPGEIFDGDVSYGMQQFTERKRDEQQFILSGVDFSGANDMLGIFNQLYTRARSAFLLDNKNSNITGILPTYIIFGFFMFLLLYGLKR